MSLRIFSLVVILAFAFLNNGCASKFLKYDGFKKFTQNKEFEKLAIEIPADEPEAIASENTSETPTEVSPEAQSIMAVPTTTTLPKAATKKKIKNAKTQKDGALTSAGASSGASAVASVDPQRRQPEIESDLGFSGRRPLIDPFKVGEKVVHDVSYMGISAGQIELEVRPFAKVNQKKAYNFRINIKTTGFFSSVYSVEDTATTFVDFDDLTPTAYQLSVKETGQLRDVKTLFDWSRNVATFWERVYTKKDGETEKNKEWEILPFSQNVFSVIYYLRNFNWEVGSEHKFRIAHDGKNLVFEGKGIRKEKLKTSVGTFDTIVIQPVVTFTGKLEPTGDNYIWLTDDDRKLIVRIESSIKIGTLVSEIVELKKGQ